MLISHAFQSGCCAVALLFGGAAAAIGLSGCEKKKEKIIDIETPETDIEIERSRKNGDLDIKIKKKKARPEK